MDSTTKSGYIDPVTTYTHFPKKEIRKIENKSAEKNVLKQLSNVNFHVENLKKVSIFPDFTVFFEEHDKFQTNIKELIEKTQDQIKTKAPEFLNGNEGAIEVHKSIKKITTSFCVALNDLKLSRQHVFSEKINKYIKLLNTELYDYSMRVKSEPKYIPLIKPFITDFSTKFKKFYLQVKKLMVPLIFEQIEIKTTTRLVRSLKDLANTLNTELMPNVSDSRTSKLITGIFVERFTRNFAIFIQTISDAPLFNERITFLEQAMSQLSMEFNMIFANVKGSKHATISKKSTTVKKETIAETKEMTNASNIKIENLMLESEVAKLKEKLDEVLITLSKTESKLSKSEDEKKELKESIKGILGRMKRLVRKDPTNEDMKILEQIYELMNQNELEQKEARTIFLKEDTMRSKLLTVYSRYKNKEEAEKLNNIELIDGIRDQQSSSMRNQKELRKELEEMCTNFGEEPKELENNELIKMIGEKMLQDKTKIAQQESEISCSEIRPKLIEIFANGGGTEQIAKEMSNLELIYAIENQRKSIKKDLAQYDNLRGRLIECYEKSGGKKEDTENMNDGEVVSGISFFVDKLNKMQNELKSVCKEKNIKLDKDDEGIIAMVGKVIETQEKSHKKLLDCLEDCDIEESDIESKDNEEIIEMIQSFMKVNREKAKDSEEKDQKLHKKLVKCYTICGGDEKKAKSKSNKELAKEMKKYLSEEKENHSKLIDLLEVSGGNRSKFEESSNSSIIDAISPLIKDSKEYEEKLHKELVESLEKCNENSEEIAAMSDLQIAEKLKGNITNMIENTILFRETLTNAYIKAGGSKEMAKEMDNKALINNLVNMQNAAFVKIMDGVHVKLSSLTQTMTGKDCSEDPTEDLLQTIEDWTATSQSKEEENNQQNSECNALIEIIVRITGKKSSNYKGMNAQKLLAIALPIVDKLVSERVDGQTLVFEQFKDILPENTKADGCLQTIRDILIKRRSTNQLSAKITNNIEHLSDMLHNKDTYLPSSDKFDEFISVVKGIEENATGLSPKLIENDVHGMIINTADVLTKMSTLLSSSEYISQKKDDVKYTNELLTKNVELSKNVEKLKKLLEEKDNQLAIESSKLRSAEKMFERYADANRTYSKNISNK